MIDAGGQLVIPGFIEGHGHFTGVGEAQLDLNLMTARTWDEIVAMVEEAVKTAKPGQWIYGRGWHQEKWTAPPAPNVEGFPDARVARAKCRRTTRCCSRTPAATPALSTRKAMELSGITRTTPSPEGGEILKDASGQADRPAARDGVAD